MDDEQRPEAVIVTMKELSTLTDPLIAAAVESGRPLLVTRHGRFVALIEPLSELDDAELVLEELFRMLQHSGETAPDPA